jgi:glycosyltransferase involved in cell wall biosynthesis
MTSSIRISIGIPTYNGADRIRSALDSIIAQITPELSPYIEVVISDNNSTDNVGSLVFSYLAKFPCGIEYSKNDKNIGYDRNVNEIFSRAKGDYVWLLADDDVLQEGAIHKVLTTLIQHSDLKLLQLNFQTFDSSLIHVVHEMKIPNDVLCEDAESFLINSKGRYGQVSTLVFCRKAWIDLGAEWAFGTNYIHIYMLLKVLAKGGRSFIFKDPLVKARTGSENFGTSGDDLLLTPLGGAKIFLQMRILGYSKFISQKLLLENRKYVFGIIPCAKNQGIAHPIKTIRSLLVAHNCLKLWLLWVPIILMPTSMFQYVYSFLRGIRYFFMSHLKL